MKLLEYTIPDYLGSYLINGDASGITEAERLEADEFCNREGIKFIEAGSISYFEPTNDINQLGAMCSTFVATPIK